jgi:hypothetical protein
MRDKDKERRKGNNNVGSQVRRKKSMKIQQRGRGKQGRRCFSKQHEIDEKEKERGGK